MEIFNLRSGDEFIKLGSCSKQLVPWKSGVEAKDDIQEGHRIPSMGKRRPGGEENYMPGYRQFRWTGNKDTVTGKLW